MKAGNITKPFPASDEEWEHLIAEAPEGVTDPRCAYDPNDPKAVEEFWKDAVIVREGGYPAVRKALAERRMRGPQKAPTKEQVAIRLSRDVLERFRAGGPGWQTRIDEALKEWVAQHPEK